MTDPTTPQTKPVERAAEPGTEGPDPMDLLLGTGSASTPDADLAPEPDPAPKPDEPKPDTDLAAEIEKWKALARKHETRAQKNADKATKYDALAAEKQTDLERSAAEAEKRGYDRAFEEFSGRLVDAEIRAQAAGREVDLTRLLTVLDRKAFLTEEGDVDVEGVKSLVDSLAKPAKTPKADLGQGKRGTTPSKEKADELADFLDENF